MVLILHPIQSFFLRGTAYRPGNKPTLSMVKDLSNEGEAETICSAIREFLKKGYSEVDIAVIVYNRRQQYTTKGWKTHYYNLLPPIKKDIRTRKLGTTIHSNLE